MRIVCKVFQPEAYELYETDERGAVTTIHGGAAPRTLVVPVHRVVASAEVFVGDGAEAIGKAHDVLRHIESVLATKHVPDSAEDDRRGDDVDDVGFEKGA